jgi:hypothetical protein
VLLDVSGKVTDVAAEIRKLEIKMAKAQEVATKLEELMVREGFEKVGEAVRATEKRRLDEARMATRNYERTIEQFRRMAM